MKFLSAFLTISLWLATYSITFSQNTNYIGTDSSIMIDLEFITNNPVDRQEFIKIQTPTGITEYSPLQLTDYGLMNGFIYQNKLSLMDNQNRYLSEG